MTKEDLAEILKVCPESVRRMAAAGKIPRIAHLRLLRFDPNKMIDVFCGAEPEGRSLTIKGHKTSEEEFLECL
jgi:hypothetical protein